MFVAWLCGLHVSYEFSWEINGSVKAKKHLQVFLHWYTMVFVCFVASQKSDKYIFCTMCAYSVSIPHGGKAEIKVHIASQKHDNYIRAVEGQGNIGSSLKNSC